MQHNTNLSLNDKIIAAVESGDIEQLSTLTEPEDVLVRDIVELTMIPDRLVEAGNEAAMRSTPFMVAASRGHDRVIHYLLWLARRYDRGIVDLDKLDANNRNALMHAAIAGHTAVVELLLKNGCDARIQYQDITGLTPPVTIAMLARNANQLAIAEMLEQAAAVKNASSARSFMREKLNLFAAQSSANSVDQLEQPLQASEVKKRRVTIRKKTK